MKIVDSENKDKLVHVSELSCGDVFIFGGDAYLKSRYVVKDCAVNLKTGIIYDTEQLQDVTPLPNAELHLNK